MAHIDALCSHRSIGFGDRLVAFVDLGSWMQAQDNWIRIDIQRQAGEIESVSRLCDSAVECFKLVVLKWPRPTGILKYESACVKVA